jgi:hypothetical protein
LRLREAIAFTSSTCSGVLFKVIFMIKNPF